jgi:cytochrome c peroxidase
MKFRLIPLSVLAVLVCLASAVLVTAQIAGDRSGRTTVARGADGPRDGGSKAAVELGRLLFWDPILSGSKDIACATCHHPDFAYADDRDLSLGTGSTGLGAARRDVSGGRIPVVKRNSPTVLNTAFNGLDRRRGRRRNFDEASLASVNQAAAPMLWDSRIRSLEAQALEPIKSREEMRGDAYSEASAVDTVLSRLRATPEYVALFKQAFGPDTSIEAQELGQAIAAFERSLVAMDSPFDRFRAGDQNALTAQERRGLEAFDAAGCDGCHEGAMFSDFDLHAEGVRENPKLAEPDAGTRRYRFRTPTLRNVALTAPYMHNGMLATLEDVLRFYDNGRSENRNVAAGGGGRRGNDDGPAVLARRFVRVSDMSDGEMRDIVAFLKSLSDTTFDKTIPARVPSGLPPGGFIHGESSPK